jgi:hypothetical protein
VTGAGTGLIDIHDELVPVLPGKNLVRSLHDGISQARLQAARLLMHQGG